MNSAVVGMQAVHSHGSLVCFQVAFSLLPAVDILLSGSKQVRLQVGLSGKRRCPGGTAAHARLGMERAVLMIRQQGSGVRPGWLCRDQGSDLSITLASLPA